MGEEAVHSLLHHHQAKGKVRKREREREQLRTREGDALCKAKHEGGRVPPPPWTGPFCPLGLCTRNISHFFALSVLSRWAKEVVCIREGGENGARVRK